MRNEPFLRRLKAFVRRQNGGTAVEFALVVPLFVALSLGIVGLGMTMSMIVSLHFAAEDAARCKSVRSTCDVATYAASRYAGPNIQGLQFTLNPVGTTCQNTVRGSGTYTFRTGLGSLTIPVSAQACYPSKT